MCLIGHDEEKTHLGGGDFMEKLYEEATRKIPEIAKLSFLYPTVEEKDDDATVQILSMKLAERITFRKDLPEILEIVSYLRMKYEGKGNEFYHGFFWALERLFFVLKNQPFSEEVLEVWKEKEKELLSKYTSMGI